MKYYIRGPMRVGSRTVFEFVDFNGGLCLLVDNIGYPETACGDYFVLSKEGSMLGLVKVDSLVWED
jgi:hypothetical protein